MPKLLAPEVVQTSAMDCGPAALKCLLDGFGLHASYGRLREACHTDVDGTSIDTLEDIANDVGLIAEQIILPVDHLLVSAQDVLPAIVVVRQPGGLLHFVVAWRHHGAVVQIMDPATGRRWSRPRAFADEVFAHQMRLPAKAWRAWTDSNLFEQGIRGRARKCGIRPAIIDSLLHEASKDESWKSAAALDASLRMITTLRASGAFGRADAGRALQALWARAAGARDDASIVPHHYWTVTAAEPVDAPEHVLVRGAVLVRVRGVRSHAERQQREAAIPRDLARALSERPVAAGRQLFAMLRGDGAVAPAAVTTAVFVAAAGVTIEALLFRSLMELGPHLPLSGQRLATMGAVLSLSVALLVLEVPIAAAAIGWGRRLEMRLRLAFLQKIPRLADRYFQSRPSSDMAERGHSIHQIRELPTLGVQLTRFTFELLFTTAGLVWLYPESAAFAMTAAVIALIVPLLAQPALMDRDLRQRTHTGALTRFYLDAFLGQVPVRAHGAERAMAREQESLLVKWAHAGQASLRTAVATSGVQLIAGVALAAVLLFATAHAGDEGGGLLLLAYWALNIPILGNQIAQFAWQYPTQRNLALRLFEPLAAPEEDQPASDAGERSPSGPRHSGVSITLRDVSVRAAGHTILENATLTIEPGTHVAIVGGSGAGKSTLVGLLLGWHVPATGSMTVDGTALEGGWLDQVRRDTAWLDPTVQLWNRSLVDNIEYGRGAGDAPVGARVVEADLRRLIEQLPSGMQTLLGEGGALVSGGEGQRVRFARSLGNPAPRLVVFDEPFRGLERERRAALLRRAREHWRNATFLCVTHDVAETSSFDRVIVLSHGRIIEDGAPAPLADTPGSRYRTMLDAQTAVGVRLWTDRSWRAVRLENGRIRHDDRRSAVETTV